MMQDWQKSAQVYDWMLEQFAFEDLTWQEVSHRARKMFDPEGQHSGILFDRMAKQMEVKYWDKKHEEMTGKWDSRD